MTSQTYFQLNNQLNIPKDGRIQLDKDKEALKAYFKEHVNQNTVFFHTLKEKIGYLIENDYIEKEMIDKYSFSFIKELFDFLYGNKFRFKSFMGAYKFYNQYAMKTRDGSRYLERYEDRVAFNALLMGDGDEELALAIAEEMINQRYQPATPTYLNAGKKARGEFVSCFPKGTKIITSTGLVNIEDVEQGLRVLTHTGRYQEVSGVMSHQYDGEAYEIDIWGTPETVTATKEHPFMIYRKIGSRNKNEISPMGLEQDGETYNLKWVAAKDILVGDYVVQSTVGMPKNSQSIDVKQVIKIDLSSLIEENGRLYKKTIDKKNNKKKNNNISQSVSSIPSEIELNYEFGYFLGAFLAEGHLSERSVAFTINSTDKEYIKLICEYGKKMSGVIAKTRENSDGSDNIYFNSVMFRDFLFELVGSGFDKKILSSHLMDNINTSFSKGLLLGVCRGDGCTTKNSLILDLTNRPLVQQLGLIARSLNYNPNFTYYISQSGGEAARLTFSATSENNRELIFSTDKSIHKFKKAVISDKYSTFIDGKPVYKVRNINKKHISEKVYNMDVLQDHTYFANGALVHNCFLIHVSDDMNGIGRSVNSALQLSKLGGGVGIGLTDIREAGAPIKGIEGAASGIVPVMKIFEDSFSYANQLGQRAGSGATYLNIFHQDVIAFLSTKKENADEKIRVKTLSLGLVVPDKFYELVENDEPMHLFSPYDIEKEYGIPMSKFDITKHYDELVTNSRISKKTIKARDLDIEISKLQQESGYPYIMNYDTVNRANPIKGLISMSNLCSEILQVQKDSVVNNDQTYDVMGTDISCNLGSLNATNLMKSNDFGKSVETAVRALTWVTDNSSIDVVPTVKKGNEEARTIGLGLMGIHEYMAVNQIHYGSKESVELVDHLWETINYHALKSSNKIAKETGESFVGFEDSKYYSGEYFDKYTQSRWISEFEKVRDIFGDLLPSVEDWKDLAENIKEYGMYHQNLLAVAP